MGEMYLGIDLGTENLKAVVLERDGGEWSRKSLHIIAHAKEPQTAVNELMQSLDPDKLAGAAVTGRLGSVLNLDAIPAKAALISGFRHLYPGESGATVIGIGSHGFMVLELRENGASIMRENSRCSQGTGNFLRQLVERFGLTIEEASEMCAGVEDPAVLSGRCPVILKTDMTHLANKGESREAILAGLYDAVCENVQVLIKPNLAPRRAFLTGGVVRSARIQNNFSRFLSAAGMELVDGASDELQYLGAFGAAIEAAANGARMAAPGELFVNQSETNFEEIPALRDSLGGVKRFPREELSFAGHKNARLILGFDVGSTGTKAVAVDADERKPIWETYTNTSGDPVGAVRKLVENYLTEGGAKQQLVGFGVTGSGREIVGSMLSSCYGAERVFVLNEIAAHAEGAIYYDEDVDTIFEIGGQDAKYIRLSGGQVCDAAMNEACSAGTGSFIEEQGKKFSQVDDVVQMGELALEAEGGISLGQHCSVFMAEIIDAAVSAGNEQGPIISGIYDSIIQNYLNRVKGSRSVGEKIFCQGMPFSAGALAAAVARQTGKQVVIPPSPGTIGALGIGLLGLKELDLADRKPMDAALYLSSRVEARDDFPCKSTKGCGEPGNRCKIDRLRTVVGEEQHKFLWGGSCSLYDNGISRAKLPDRSPDPFKQREALVAGIIEQAGEGADGLKTVGISEEFVLKLLTPFYASFVRELGFKPVVFTNGGRKALKAGIENATVPLCAPMQIYTGLVDEIADAGLDYVFLPMLRDLARIGDEHTSTTCPLAQGSRDMVRDAVEAKGSRVIDTIVDMGPGNLDSELFMASCVSMAEALGVSAERAERAHRKARKVQLKFDADCAEIGRNALEFCRDRNLPAVVVLGRAYTIYNNLLNSNVPNLLREQGAMAIPVDCYQPADDTPVFESMYWGYSQVNLRAAHSIRREPEVYSLFCSNYSCGPDSFNLHFYSYIMENKPFAIIETDGHSGDAGTKTRVEAFLYCVDTDRRARVNSCNKPVHNLKDVEARKSDFRTIRENNEVMLLPRMGEGATAIAACFQGEGINAHAMDMPTRETVSIGRRHTSGKECIPMTITLGSVLEAVERYPDDQKFTIFLPTANGPCRFGVYNLMHKIVYEKLGLEGRVRIISQPDHDYFEGLSPGFQVKALSGVVAADMLHDMYHWVRPVEAWEGAAKEIYERYCELLNELLAKGPAPHMIEGVRQMGIGKLFGIKPLVTRAAGEFASVMDEDRTAPTVAFVGEIYVRCDPFANDFLIERLENRGIRARLAPIWEWVEYTDWLNYKKADENRLNFDMSWLGARVTSLMQYMIIETLYAAASRHVPLPERVDVRDMLDAADEYMRRDLHGEAVLTIGGPLYEYRHGQIDGVVSTGPLECMPAKLAESQFFRITEDTGMPVLAVYVNGDQVDSEVIDNFAYEVKASFADRERMRARKESLSRRRPRNARNLARHGANARRVLFSELKKAGANLIQQIPGASARVRIPGLGRNPLAALINNLSDKDVD